MHNIGQGHQVKVPAESVHWEEVLYKVLWLKALQHMEGWRKRCKSQWSAKYRSRSPSQGTCRVRTVRRSTMQGLMVVGLIVEEILNIDVKCVKGTGAQNIGQGHRVKIPAESVHLGEALCKVLVARGLKLEEIWNVDVNYVSHCSQNIGQGHQVKVSAKSVRWEEALCKVWWL